LYEPNGGAWGPQTCKPGYVWREAQPRDRVCVTPDRRARAHVDNAGALYYMKSVESAPANGVYVGVDHDDRELRSTRWYIVGAFTPNKFVRVYAYDRYRLHGDRGLVEMHKTLAHSNGNLTSRPDGRAYFYWRICNTAHHSRPTAPIIVIDEGTGTVSNAGETTAPWC